MESRGKPFAHFVSGPFEGLPVTVRAIPLKSRMGLMTTGRRLIDWTSDETSKAAYDKTRLARAVACAILGGMINPNEAQALKLIWSLKTNGRGKLLPASIFKLLLVQRGPFPFAF